MVEKLLKMGRIKRRGPLLLVIIDGVGFNDRQEGNALTAACTPTFDRLEKTAWRSTLKAHGKAVGLPSDGDMGNSEVGHNAIGSGRIFDQGAKLINNSLASGRLFNDTTWKKLIKNCLDNSSTLHLIGLLSDGNVHSHIDHLQALVSRAKKEKIQRLRVHALLDGRDVGETSALDYFEPFEQYLAKLNSADFDAAIASGGGRMQITMDRYGADWSMVQRGWQTHVLGEGRQFSSAVEAIKILRDESGALDQDLPPFVVGRGGRPVGTIEDGDSVVLFNFRGDRALEISAAFEQGDQFDFFDRRRRPAVCYAGMMQYDGDNAIPKEYLVAPPQIDRVMSEYLVTAGVRQYAISETQKYGHVTYFFNGNRLDKFDPKLETYQEIASDNVSFSERPWMKSAEICDQLLAALDSGDYDFLRVNFANGDMVGHTGNFAAAVTAVSAVDLALARLTEKIRQTGGIMLLTADHGNCEEMYERDKKSGQPLVDKDSGKLKAKTSHTLNKVPCIVYDPEYNGEYAKTLRRDMGISSLAATCMNLLDYRAPKDYDQSLLIFENDDEVSL